MEIDYRRLSNSKWTFLHCPVKQKPVDVAKEWDSMSLSPVLKVDLGLKDLEWLEVKDG